MRLIISSDYAGSAQWAADYVAYKIKAARPTPNKPFVMAIPAGSSPLGIYQRLIEMNRKGKLSFENVVIFNMNEYIGLEADDHNSYRSFLWENLFKHINIHNRNIHLLNGQTKNFAKECADFEKLIRSYGGIDLVLAGVGEDGHIAFNEPGSSLASRTRVKMLNKTTRESNARFFGGDINKVPRNVITVGIATIMDAREVLVIASGEKKAKAIYGAVEGYINHLSPISILQMHPHAIIACDQAATVKLNPEIVKYFQENEELKTQHRK